MVKTNIGSLTLYGFEFLEKVKFFCFTGKGDVTLG